MSTRINEESGRFSCHPLVTRKIRFYENKRSYIHITSSIIINDLIKISLTGATHVFGLKIPRPKGHTGSIPVSGTNTIAKNKRITYLIKYEFAGRRPGCLQKSMIFPLEKITLGGKKMAYFRKRSGAWEASIEKKGIPRISRTFDTKAGAETGPHS